MFVLFQMAGAKAVVYFGKPNPIKTVILLNSMIFYFKEFLKNEYYLTDTAKKKDYLTEIF